MTAKPKEKAEEMINKYQNLNIEIGGKYDGYLTLKIHNAIECALIATDEITGLLAEINNEESFNISKYANYYHEVKEEITKLNK